MRMFNILVERRQISAVRSKIRKPSTLMFFSLVQCVLPLSDVQIQKCFCKADNVYSL